MSIPLTHIFDFTIANALHLAGILVLALLCKRVLHTATNGLVKPATMQSKGAQQREQQTRALAEKICAAGSCLIWIIAALTALPEFGISALPAVIIAGATLLGFSIGSRDTIRDAVAGLQIGLEDQFAVGDSIQVGDTTGRVEQMSLRRTVVRDGHGALVSLSNGELRTVGNLSRDWSQAYVDIGIESGVRLEKALQALESAANELRGDAAWSQALVDGPRVLGVQGYDHTGTTLRLQLRTAPTRQDEVCRELRRRIQMTFERQSIAVARREATGAPETPLS